MRPYENSQSILSLCKQQHIQVLHEPIYHYHYFDFSPSQRLNLENADRVLITSQAVFHHPSLIDYKNQLIDKAIYCVGEKTAYAAKTFGFMKVKQAQGDVFSLIEMLKEEMRSLQQVNWLYLTGRPRKQNIENFLLEHKMPHSVIELYQSEYIQTLPESIMKAIHENEIDFIPVFSQEAAKSIMRCFQNTNIKLNGEHQLRFICFSDKIAKLLANEAIEVLIAKEQKIEAMLDIMISNRLKIRKEMK